MTIEALDRTSAARRVLAAPNAAALFGTASAAEGTPGWAEARRTYRKLALRLHPDVCNDPAAEAAFHRLAELWMALSSPATAITTRKRSYTLGGLAHRGDVTNLYTATSPSLPTAVLVKMPRSARNNDLLEAEARALSQLHRDGDVRYRAYAPVLIETFRHRDTATGTDRRVNVVEQLDGFVSLTDVTNAYPNGVDPRDAAWMWRRLLVALGYAHRAGVVHGAVLPEHVLIHPGEHGLVLVDWCYATTDAAQTVPAIVPRHRSLYPDEVLTKKPATAATDLHLAARTMAALMGPRMPQPMKAFVTGCTVASQRARPQDAWRLLDELDELLERLYGPRRFRVFTMPTH